MFDGKILLDVPYTPAVVNWEGIKGQFSIILYIELQGIS